MAETVRRRDERAKALRAGAGLTLVLGLITVAIPQFTAGDPVEFWTDVVTGLLVTGLAAYAFWTPGHARFVGAAWAMGAAAVLGLFLMGFALFAKPPMAFFWWNVGIGVLLFFVAAFTAWTASPAGDPADGPRRTRA